MELFSTWSILFIKKLNKIYNIEKPTPSVAFGKLIAGLLNPISDGVGRDVILLGQVAGADVVLQHLPHDPSALLRGEGRGADGAAGKKEANIGFRPHRVGGGQLE